MATDVLMPQMGESITEGTVVKWLKKVGDTVQRDEPLLEISTDKVDAEIPAPAAGVVTEILAKEGDTVAINSVLARLGEAGEVGAGVSAAAAGAAPAMGEAAPAREAPRQVEAPPAQADGDSRPLPSQAPPPQPQAAPPPPPAAAEPAPRGPRPRRRSGERGPRLWCTTSRANTASPSMRFRAPAWAGASPKTTFSISSNSARSPPPPLRRSPPRLLRQPLRPLQ